MAAKPKKATAAKPKTAKEPKAEAAKAPAAETKIFNTPMDEENRKLFLSVHLPEIKKLREKLNTANANLRNGYKTAKAEGGFTKADFDYAVQVEDEEKEAKAKARIARQLVIARYMGKSLGSQLELFMEPDRTPASDIAFEEGKRDALANISGGAKPGYDPSTEQHRRYMEGFHSVSESRVKAGIKPLPPEVAADQAAKEEAKAKADAQKAEDAEAFGDTIPKEQVTSGVPTSRAQFLAAQQREREEKEGSAFSKRN